MIFKLNFFDGLKLTMNNFDGLKLTLVAILQHYGKHQPTYDNIIKFINKYKAIDYELVNDCGGWNLTIKTNDKIYIIWQEKDIVVMTFDTKLDMDIFIERYNDGDIEPNDNIEKLNKILLN